MRAITEWAPYGSFIASGHKTIETRPKRSPWRCAIGETIAIHQGMKWAPGWLRWFDPEDWRINALDELNVALNEDANGSGYYRPHRRDLPLGAVVATATLVNVVPIVSGWDCSNDPHVCIPGGAWLTLHNALDGPEPTEVDIENQRPFGDFADGRFALLLDDVRKVAPFPCRGRQGLWTLPDDVADNLVA